MAKAKKKSQTKKPARSAAKKTSAKKPMAKKAAAKKPAAGKKSAAKKSVAKKSVKPMLAKAPVKAASPKINWQDFLTPLDDRLIIELATAERVTPGGLFIPDTAADLSGNFRGQVLAAGRGHRDEKGRVRPMDVKAGDVILFAEYAGSKMDLQGKEVRILRESEVLGIVEKK